MAGINKTQKMNRQKSASHRQGQKIKWGKKLTSPLSFFFGGGGDDFLCCIEQQGLVTKNTDSK
jgi:hypothetical protein